jgi:CheY-like chemotaxis protein/HPt (histidine-containing phosphotransfer) domain-containing protein
MKVAENCGTGSRWTSVFQRIPVPAWIAAKLRDRPDSEHELAFYRLAAGALAGCYLLIAGSLEGRGGHDLLGSIVWLFAAFELASLGIFCHLLLRPGASAARRLAGILLDLGALSYCMHVGGETALPLYPLYLLAILANGFRFGTRYLLAAADTAVASFALVTVATEFFAAHPGLSLGLLGGLIVPALQVCALMRGLQPRQPRSEAPSRMNGPIATGIADTPDQGNLTATAARTPGHADPQAPPDLDASGEPSEEPVRRLAILVAEDNVTYQKVIAKILEKAGHDAQIVDNGQAAAEAVAKGAFDAVLMDIEMPVLNGIEAAKLIRFLSTGRPRVPIVALVTQADEPTQTRCEQAGMDACIAKPIEPAGLLQALEAAISLEPHTRPPRSAQAAETGKPEAVPKPTPSALDLRTLESLKALGGDDFVEELAQQFIDDAAGVLGELSQAVARGDAQGFREHAHALRSGAANIGAHGVYEMCLGWRRIDPATLSSKGHSCLRELEQEFGRVRAALQDYRDYRAARKRSGLAVPAAQSGATPLRA